MNAFDLTFYEAYRSNSLFFDPNPKGGEISDLQTPLALAVALADRLSNPDPSTSQRTQG